MEKYIILKGSRIFLFWEQHGHDIKGCVWNNRAALFEFIKQLIIAIEKCKDIYSYVDEDNTNIKRLEKIAAELNISMYKLKHNKMKGVVKWSESFKAITSKVLDELSILRELFDVFNRNYIPSGGLLNRLKNSTEFIITFHRTGNQKPWVAKENIYYGVQWVNNIAPTFHSQADALPANFKRMGLGIECDFTWMFREKEYINPKQQQIITYRAQVEKDLRFIQGPKNKFETMHTFFTHPDNVRSLVTGKIHGGHVKNKWASFEATRPEYVLKKRDPRVHMYIHVQWGINGKSQSKDFYYKHALTYLLYLFKKYGILHTHVQMAGVDSKYMGFIKKFDPEIPTEILAGKPFPNINPRLVVGFLNPIPKGLFNLPKNIFRIKRLSIIDTHVDFVPPKDILNLRRKVIALAKKGKMYNPQLINIFKLEYVDNKIMLKRLLRSYISECMGVWVESFSLDAVMGFPKALMELNKRVIILYQSL